MRAEEVTDEVQNEADALKTEMKALATQEQAAILAEGDEEARARGLFGNGDGEAAEVRGLLDRVSLGDYLTPAGAGSGIEGRARELNAALKVDMQGKSGGVAVPWAMLEARAFTSTADNDGSNVQRPILQRLFGPGVLDILGVRIDSVPVGRSEWPLLTGGVAPDQAKEETAAGAAVDATFEFANLKPKRLTGRYEFTHEAAAVSADLESALRRDLGDAVMSKMSDRIINGVAPTNSNPQHVRGFLNKIGAATDLSSAEADAAAYGRLHSLGVDGIHAGMETEVSSVIGDESVTNTAAGVYLTGSAVSGSELLKTRSGGCVASTYIPAKASHEAIGDPARGRGERRGDARGFGGGGVADAGDHPRYLQQCQSVGVTLTWVALWDAEVAFRSCRLRSISPSTSADHGGRAKGVRGPGRGQRGTLVGTAVPYGVPSPGRRCLRGDFPEPVRSAMRMRSASTWTTARIA